MYYGVGQSTSTHIYSDAGYANHNTTTPQLNEVGYHWRAAEPTAA